MCNSQKKHALFHAFCEIGLKSKSLLSKRLKIQSILNRKNWKELLVLKNRTWERLAFTENTFLDKIFDMLQNKIRCWEIATKKKCAVSKSTQVESTFQQTKEIIQQKKKGENFAETQLNYQNAHSPEKEEEVSIASSRII